MDAFLVLCGLALGIFGGWALVYGLITMNLMACVAGVLLALFAVCLIALVATT